jgi:hypothetical protein
MFTEHKQLRWGALGTMTNNASKFYPRHIFYSARIPAPVIVFIPLKFFFFKAEAVFHHSQSTVNSDKLIANL